MNLRILTLGGDEIANVIVEPEALGSELKRIVHETEGTVQLLQQLVCDSRCLQDDASLKDQGVDGSHPLVLLRRQWAEVEDEAAKASMERYGQRYCMQHHFFWAVHDGNWPAVIGLLRLRGVSIDGEMSPSDFEDARRQHPYPYSQFDGRYGDRAIHLAARCCDTLMLAALLRCRADVSLRNDNNETALDIALGKGTRWENAFLKPHNFGGSREHIVHLLDGSASPNKDDLLVAPRLLTDADVDWVSDGDSCETSDSDEDDV